MHCIGVDAVSEVSADRASVGLLGIGSTHQVTVLQHSVFAFQGLHKHGAGDHEVHQVLEERAGSVHSVELFGFGARQLHQTGSHNLQASGFKAGDDLADDVLGDGVGLDNGEGTFDSHF